MKDNFEEKLRQQLEGFESQEIPEGLWEGIEQKLDAPKVVPLWKKLSAAASVLLIIGVGFGLFNLVQDEIVQQYPVADNANPMNDTDSSVSENYGLPDVQDEGIKTLPDATKVTSVKRYLSNLVQKHMLVTASDSESTAETVAPEIENVHAEEEVEQQHLVTKPQVTNDKQFETKHSLVKQKSTNHIGGRISLRLFASRMPQGNFNNLQGYLALSNEGIPDNRPIPFLTRSKGLLDAIVFANANTDSKPETNTTYSQPIRFGLSVGYEISKRWGIDMGVSYSRLNSTLTSGSDHSYYTNDQRIDYLGIPVNVSYNIVKTGNLRVYVSAGEMTEFGLSGNVDVRTVRNNRQTSFTENKIDDIPIQFSVNSAAGIEYSFYKGIGVFAEPGISYHFRDHSDISTIYKAHPLNFNLQLGFRWIINK